MRNVTCPEIRPYGGTRRNQDVRCCCPHFRLHVHSRGCLSRSELALSAHNSDTSFRGTVRPRLPFWISSGLWARLSSASNRPSLLRRLSPYARLFFLLRGVLRFRSSSYHSRASLLSPVGVRPLSFPTASVILPASYCRPLSLARLLQASGPVLLLSAGKTAAPRSGFRGLPALSALTHTV